MSTTVTYKGSTLTTVDNQTRTLKTAGKYMEGDVILTDVSSGGGYVTQDQDGFIILPSDGDGSPSVGGLVYETGTWTPSEDVVRPTISFTNTHTDIPMCILFSDATGSYNNTSYTNYAFSFSNYYGLTGEAINQSETTLKYATCSYLYRVTTADGLAFSTTQIIYSLESDNTSSGSYKYFVTNTEFKPWGGSNSRYWRTGRTYKWIAIWAPTS